MNDLEKDTKAEQRAEEQAAQKKEKKAEKKRRKQEKAGSGKGKKKKTGLIIALVLAALFVGYSVVSSVIAKNTPMQVTTITASLGNVEETLSTSGTVSSEQSRTYYAPVGASISQMPIQVGDEVKAGDQLVVFDTADLENQSAKAQLEASAASNSYRSAQYQSDKNQSEYNEATIGLEELKTLAQQQEQYVQGLTYQLEDAQQKQKEKLQDWLGKLNMELEIQNNKLSQPHDEETRERIEEIIQNLNNSIRETSNQISDLSMSEEMKARARQIDAEKKKLEDMNEEISRREGKESSSEAGITDPYAKQQQADNMKSAQITAGEAANDLELAREGVTAEFSGIVTRIGAAPTGETASPTGSLEGAAVAAGAELCTIESNEQVMVGIEVTKYDLAKIEVGQKAEITISDKTYEGQVSKINKVAGTNAQGSSVVGAEIHINNPDSDIFLGVEAKVLIHTAQAENVVTLPVEIVNTDKQGDFCYVVENGVVTMRRITTGISSDTMVEVKEGLKEGDQILYDMTGTITEGMKVQAVPMDTAGLGTGADDPSSADAPAEETETTAETETASGLDEPSAASADAAEEAGEMEEAGSEEGSETAESETTEENTAR